MKLFLPTNIYFVKKILHTTLKRKVIKSINELGSGYSELIVDLPLSFGKADTIEYSKEEDKVLIHFFKDDYDLIFDFEEIDEDDKIQILKILKTI